MLLLMEEILLLQICSQSLEYSSSRGGLGKIERTSNHCFDHHRFIVFIVDLVCTVFFANAIPFSSFLLLMESIEAVARFDYLLSFFVLLLEQ